MLWRFLFWGWEERILGKKWFGACNWWRTVVESEGQRDICMGEWDGYFDWREFPYRENILGS